ncbi:hypothetical protein LDENG_00183390 [Lucifuga dentata]|nr:hypothetical protein LDENG_00183390 [Lucifuga dentata]
MFVQIQQKWRRMYAGECQGPGVHTDFEMVHLRKVPSQHNHLSGLIDIFKSKIGCILTPLPPINITIRFTYILQDWQQYSWPQQPPGRHGHNTRPKALSHQRNCGADFHMNNPHGSFHTGAMQIFHICSAAKILFPPVVMGI